jgi:type IV pilus assembly protein PilC
VQVGEANGTLDQMIGYAADLMERARRLRNDLMQAFSYPAFVIVAGLGVAWFMATKVIPKILEFIQARQGRSGGLPPVTQALLDVTAFFQDYGLLVLAVPVVLLIAFVLARRQRATGEIVDRWLLRVPLLGGAFRAHANTMWCRTLGALLGSGVGIVSALELVERSLGNWYVAAQFRLMRQEVREGRSLTHALDRTALPTLCPMARAMIAVSEQSGGLDTSLAQVADHYEDVLQRRVKLLSRLVEPAMYAIVGGMVGFVYFAFFMAMMAAQRSSF